MHISDDQQSQLVEDPDVCDRCGCGRNQHVATLGGGCDTENCPCPGFTLWGVREPELATCATCGHEVRGGFHQGEMCREIAAMRRELRIAIPALTHAYGSQSDWVKRVSALANNDPADVKEGTS